MPDFYPDKERSVPQEALVNRDLRDLWEIFAGEYYEEFVIGHANAHLDAWFEPFHLDSSLFPREVADYCDISGEITVANLRLLFVSEITDKDGEALWESQLIFSVNNQVYAAKFSNKAFEFMKVDEGIITDCEEFDPIVGTKTILSLATGVTQEEEWAADGEKLTPGRFDAGLHLQEILKEIKDYACQYGFQRTTPIIERGGLGIIIASDESLEGASTSWSSSVKLGRETGDGNLLIDEVTLSEFSENPDFSSTSINQLIVPGSVKSMEGAVSYSMDHTGQLALEEDSPTWNIIASEALQKLTQVVYDQD